MWCLRCLNPMTFERFMSESASSSHWSYEGWHCIFCGDIVDPVIIANRRSVYAATVWRWPITPDPSPGSRAA